MTENPKAMLTGNMALAMGGVAAGVKFYCAYPMSPATGVLHWMAPHARQAGMMVRQVEDEIGVINMAIGAAHTGGRAMCATSGGGFALMTEGLGYVGHDGNSRCGDRRAARWPFHGNSDKNRARRSLANAWGRPR